MKYHWLRWVMITPAFVLALALTTAAPARADVNGFTVTSFSADYYLTKADPQGQMRIVERIGVDFTDYNHGILRAIPMFYKGHPLQPHINAVSSPSGAPAAFTTKQEDGNKVLQIGDPNQTVTGEQAYIIDYTLHNVVTFYPGHDELYWDINGDQWQQMFDHVAVVLHLPDSLKLSDNVPQCFTGSFGATGKECTVEVRDSTIIAATTEPVYMHQTLTLVAGFQKGYFRPMDVGDYVRDYAPYGLQVVVPILLIGGAGFLWWLRRGRDAKGTGVIIPQYDAPDNLTPLEVGAIADFAVDNRDVTATIISLAIRKHIRIVEMERTGLIPGIGGGKDYGLQFLNHDWRGLDDWEQTIMTSLFYGNGVTHDIVRLPATIPAFQESVKSIRNSVLAVLTDRDYFVSNPAKYLAVTVVGAVLAGLLVIWYAPVVKQGLLLWGVVAGGVVFGIFYHFLPARTAKGVAALEHIKGLKLYLEVAEKDRIKMLESPGAPYAARSDAPVQTVELFEKLLPYAVVLKVEDQWAKKFKGIYMTPPDWYAGNFNAFSAGYLVGSLGSGFNSALGTTSGASRSASGSGFGGGGFAGGGGGGGGGGGW